MRCSPFFRAEIVGSYRSGNRRAGPLNGEHSGRTRSARSDACELAIDLTQRRAFGIPVELLEDALTSGLTEKRTT